MNNLPEEVILHILSFLEVKDIVHLQAISTRYLTIGRDSTLWKTSCFTHSRAEALRRRQQLLSVQDSRLAELRNAVTALPSGDLTAWDVSQLLGSTPSRASPDSAGDARVLRSRALASWEPGYPGERLNYYEEFVHRHAPVSVCWIDLPKRQGNETLLEATGVGIISSRTGDDASHMTAPLDDGSICLWDISARSTYTRGGGGRLVAQSKAGTLTGRPADAAAESKSIMTETGAVECVSVDNDARKAYFAVQSLLHEVDLTTLQVTSTKQYPFPITALSESKDKVPLTVGTNNTIHLHDPRDPAFLSAGTVAAGELIGGSLYSHATLSQPGPLSILHFPGPGNSDDSSILVAGRFTSLLHYDRRFFPRLRGTIHSGARIAALSSLPYPLISQNLDLVCNPEAFSSALHKARSSRGTTVLAAAEYKGKGSLELYGLPSVQPYQNRQTASASKLLSVAPHGGQIVFSDGDGNLKWVERDGFSHVRSYNINDSLPLPDTAAGGPQDSTAYGIWSSTANEMPGQGDIVQKILPTSTDPNHASSGSGRTDINQSNLLLWTGDGRLGLLGFGLSDPLGEVEWQDAIESQQAESAEQRARRDAERQYGMAMRRALERNADEVRFVRGLGMGR